MLFRGPSLPRLVKINFPPDLDSSCSQRAKRRLQKQSVTGWGASGLSIPSQTDVILAPDICIRALLWPLPPKLVLAPAGCAPRPNVSPSCHRAVLRVRFPTAPLSVHLPVLNEKHSWSGRSPTTQVQCTALVIASMMSFPDAVDKRAIDVLEVKSACLEPFCKKVAVCPLSPFPLSSPIILYNREEWVGA